MDNSKSALTIEEQLKITTRAEVYIYLTLLARHPQGQTVSQILEVCNLYGAPDLDRREICYILACMEKAGATTVEYYYYSRLTQLGIERAESLRKGLYHLTLPRWQLGATN